MNLDLELAKRVLPDVPWQYDDMHGIVYDPRCGARFYPLDTHFPDVLAWLLSRKEAWFVTGQDVHSIDISSFTIKNHVDHNGTAAGIAQAVYEAAIRIVEADQ